MKASLDLRSCALVLVCLALAAVGCSGEDGGDGADGMDGMNGAPGARGPAGEDGVDGMNGAPGARGPAGEDGVDGMDGVDGADGDAGVDGMDGIDGMTGPQGPSGIIDRTKLTGRFVIYPLVAQQASGVTGDVRFAEFVDGSTAATLITVRVNGTIVPDTLRVAHVHYNDLATGGSPAVTLNKVDGFTNDGTGMSETLVTNIGATATNAADPTETFVSGAAITYDDWVGTGVMGSGTGFNGYVNVHVIPTDPVASTVSTAAVAAGDIGENY
jgi:hypothetical protein